ncbi:unnamed protein product [Rhizophagus irregularis]|nr:unnamed protein product [Rhizophagus irregularis]
MNSLQGNIKFVVAIDFGTISSGYAYAHNPSSSLEEITVENKWDGFTGYKTPTIIRYQDDYSTVKSWGFSALPSRPKKKTNDNSKLIELFKLFLFKDLMEKPSLPDKLDYKKVITDYLNELGKMIKDKLHTFMQRLDFYSQVLIVITIPVEFDDDAIETMRDCAFNAGLMKKRDSECLRFITEQNKLKPGDSFIVVDCGGGTVNLTRHEFLELLRRKLGDPIIELLEDHYNLLQYMVQEFCNEVKESFTEEKSEFNRYEINLNNYSSLKDIIRDAKERGLLREADCLIWVEFNDVRGMFDPLINKIIDLIKGQLTQQTSKKCSAIMLVGGFSESEYLQGRIKKEFNNVVSNISVPKQPMIAVLKGGVQYGLQVGTVVNRVLRRTYGTDIIRRSMPGDPASQMLPNGYTIIFDALAGRGKQILVNQKVVRKFKPHSIMQPSIGFDLYVTSANNAKFCNDPGVKLLRLWEIELPDDYEDITILFTITFGTVEILATAENQKTGEKYHVKVKYE